MAYTASNSKSARNPENSGYLTIHFTFSTRIGHFGARVDENINFWWKEAVEVIEATEAVEVIKAVEVPDDRKITQYVEC